MPTIYTLKRDEGNYLYALILTPNSSSPTEMRGWETIGELKQELAEHYGQDAQLLPPSKFQKELEARQTHTPEIVSLLERHGELLGQDLSSYAVYGSRNRPMSATWVRIPDAVFMQCDERDTTGYHTYVAVPWRLDTETIDRYELTFVSRPA